MTFTSLPTWIYWPAKFLLVISLLTPMYFWGYSQGKTHDSIHNRSNHHRIANGIDVSHYQGIINWEKVGKSDLTFVYAKATGGETYVDPHFNHNWNGIRSTDLYRGAYHFFLASDDPLKQAEHFVHTVGPLREDDLPPMLDVEIYDHASRETIEAGALIWLEAVENATGRRPVIYTGSRFGTEVLSNSNFSKYPLWIAEYADEIKRIPIPWKHAGWTIWQHAESVQVDGITGHVDLNRFHSDVSSLKDFIKHSHQK